MAGGAPEIVEADGFQREITLTTTRTGIKFLHAVLIVKTPTFQQNDFLPGIQELQGQADAGHTGTDDADIPFDQCLVRKLPGIDMHTNYELKLK